MHHCIITCSLFILTWRQHIYGLKVQNDTMHQYISKFLLSNSQRLQGIISCMRSANERRRYIVMSSLNGGAHTQNHPCADEKRLRDYHNLTSTFVHSLLQHTKLLWCGYVQILLILSYQVVLIGCLVFKIRPIQTKHIFLSLFRRRRTTRKQHLANVIMPSASQKVFFITLQ